MNALEASARLEEDFENEFEAKFDDIRLREEVDKMRRQAVLLREKESEMRQLVADPTLLATSDLAVALGRIRLFAANHHLVELDGLVDDVETALDDQIMLLMQCKSSAVVTPTHGDGHAISSWKGRAPGDVSSKERGTMEAHGPVGHDQQATDHSHQPCPGLGAADMVSGAAYLVLESLSQHVKCKSMRLFILPCDSPMAKCVVTFPDCASKHSFQLPRVVATATVGKQLALSGYDLIAPPSTSAASKPPSTDSVAAGVSRPRPPSTAGTNSRPTLSVASAPIGTYLSWPVFAWITGERIVAGVIECIERDVVMATDSDPSSTFGSSRGTEGTAMSNVPKNAHRFTNRDEHFVNVAAHIIGSWLEKYPRGHFFKSGAPNALKGEGNTGFVEPVAGLPPLSSFTELRAANETAAVAVSAASEYPTLVYRAPTQSIHKFGVVASGGGAGQGRGGQSEPPASATGVVSSGGYAGDLRTVGESGFAQSHVASRLRRQRCHAHAMQDVWRGHP